jgi:hypothetical protein
MDANQEKTNATHSKENENQLKTPERRNAGQVRQPSQKDDGRGGLLARENEGLYR